MKMHEMADRLDELSDWHDRDFQHWVAFDCGPDLCGSCAKIEAGFERFDDVMVDGGWNEHFKSDHPTYCERCGRGLHYSLTNSGLGDELDHFITHPPTQLHPSIAYELARMCWVVDYPKAPNAPTVFALGWLALSVGPKMLPPPSPKETGEQE